MKAFISDILFDPFLNLPYTFCEILHAFFNYPIPLILIVLLIFQSHFSDLLYILPYLNYPNLPLPLFPIHLIMKLQIIIFD